MCHLYIVYYQFMNGYSVFMFSGLPWTKNHKVAHGSDSKELSSDDYSPISFYDDNSIVSQDSFHSFVDDGSNQSTQIDMTDSF